MLHPILAAITLPSRDLIGTAACPRARLAQGPFGPIEPRARLDPGPVWAQGPCGPRAQGQFGPCRFVFRCPGGRFFWVLFFLRFSLETEGPGPQGGSGPAPRPRAGAMDPWAHGPMSPWALGPWAHGLMRPRAFYMGPWALYMGVFRPYYSLV